MSYNNLTVVEILAFRMLNKKQTRAALKIFKLPEYWRKCTRRSVLEKKRIYPVTISIFNPITRRCICFVIYGS